MGLGGGADEAFFESKSISGAATSLPRVGSALLVLQEHRILLGQRGKDPNRGRWVIPGGKVEPFETLAEAGRRELREETGLDVEVDCQIGAFEIVEPPDEHRLIVYSWAHPVAGVLRPSSDLTQALFFTKDELMELPLTAVGERVLNSVGWL